MKPWQIGLALVLSCTASGAAGFWFGFREGLPFGLAADSLPRAVNAAGHLTELRAGKTANVMLMLEYDIDNGLIAGYDIVEHPLRGLLGPVWGFNIYPEYNKYVIRLANYRKEYPSLLKSDASDIVPQGKEQDREFYSDVAKGNRENVGKINIMVERYASSK